jgi:hypothetical protein
VIKMRAAMQAMLAGMAYQYMHHLTSDHVRPRLIRSVRQRL